MLTVLLFLVLYQLYCSQWTHKFYLPRIIHDDVIKWKHFPRHCPFLRGFIRSLLNSLHKGQWRGAFMFSLICVWINGWENNREAGDLKRYRAHYDVIVMRFVLPALGQSWNFPLVSEVTWAMCFFLRMYRVYENSMKRNLNWIICGVIYKGYILVL